MNRLANMNSKYYFLCTAANVLTFRFSYVMNLTSQHCTMLSLGQDLEEDGNALFLPQRILQLRYCDLCVCHFSLRSSKVP